MIITQNYMKMKEEMTLTTGVSAGNNNASVAISVAKAARRVLSPLARYYSGVLGVELGIRQTLELVNAQAAFFLAVFPADCPLALRAACLGWLVAALRRCRRMGLKVGE